MKEKKQFMWFEEKNSSPQLALSDKANRVKIGQEMREKKHFFYFWINLHKLQSTNGAKFLNSV